MNHRQPPYDKSSPDYGAEDEFSDAGTHAVSRGLNVKRLLLDILNRWYWIVLGLVIGILASSYNLSKAPEKYSATASLLIKQQTAGVISRDRVDELDMRSAEGLNTAVERIRRFELLERVASRADVRSLKGLIPPAVDWRPEWLAQWLDGESNTERTTKDEAVENTPPPPPPALAGFIGSRMNVYIRRGTRLVDISFTHEVPEVAKALADAVAREYLAELAANVTEGRTSQSDTLVAQSEQARAKLQAAESALASYNRAIELHKALETQENTVSRLSRRYLPKHPSMISAHSELEELKRRFLDEFNVATQSSADREYWHTVSGDIEAAKEDIDNHLRVARQLLLARTGVLQGEINSQMSVFNTMLTRIQESNVNRQGDESNAEIHSFARVPYNPSSPNRKKTLMTGSATGLVSGLAIAFLLVRIDNKFHSVAQIEEEAGLPVLAAIADLPPRKLDQAARHYFQNHEAEEFDPHQETWDPHLVFRPGTSSTNFAEMFRVLRASISLLGDEAERKITLFSSALPGEGKTVVSSNHALAAAGQGRKTLLIDLDLRKPNLHRVFGILNARNRAGVTDWLAGQTTLDNAILDDVGAENFHLLLSGKRAPNPGELLSVTRLKQLFAEACERYDLVIIDSAPLLAVPDTRIIAPLVHNLCLVARADFVPKRALSRTIDLLESAGTTPSGIVLNGFKETRRMIGENYSYGSYRFNRYGSPCQYGYGTYGSYGAYGTDETDADEEILKRKRKANRNKARQPTHAA